ncbi:MAG: hypothetical protein JWN95_1555 [Frankiales bacterium]|nr:hypothetical protein [Frankiales bacterium]
MRIAGSTALVTGSSQGIGAAVARALNRQGARVYAHGRGSTELDDIAHELGTPPIVADLATADGVNVLLDQLKRVSELGHSGVDLVVHSAGIGHFGPMVDMPVHRMDELLRTNLVSSIELTAGVLPAMLEKGRGHVCFVGSIAGLTGVAGEAVYSASKFGVSGFAESLRLELAATGIEVTIIHPGVVRTNFFLARGAGYDRRFPRPIDPDRVASTVVASIRRNRARAVVPRWLGLAPAVRSIAPAGYDRLARRFG